MSGIALAYGSYQFPAGWTIVRDEDMRTVPMAAIPRRDGEAWQTATRKARRFTLNGGIYLSALPAGCTTVRDGIDQLKSALYSGPANFQVESDRYFRNAQVDGAPVTHGPAYGSYAEISLNILCPDPYEYSTTTTTTGELLSFTYTLALGNADALPAWYFYANGTLGTAFDWSWFNLTTGETVKLSGAWPISGAGYLIVDTLQDTVMSAPSLGGGTPGPADAGAQTDAYGLFEGQMPRFVQGVNTLTLTESGPSIASARAMFNARWQ